MQSSRETFESKLIDEHRLQEIFGGNAVSDEYHIGRHVSNLFVTQTYEGQSDIHGKPLLQCRQGSMTNAFQPLSLEEPLRASRPLCKSFDAAIVSTRQMSSCRPVLRGQFEAFIDGMRCDAPKFCTCHDLQVVRSSVVLVPVTP